MSDVSVVESFIRRAPKVDLHIHLVGAASRATVAQLAAGHPGSGVPATLDELDEWFTFTDFNHFIDIYTAVLSLVRSGGDITALIEGVAQDLVTQNVRYAEVTVTPLSHVRAGIPYSDLVEGMQVGRAAALTIGVDLAWVFDFAGENGPEEAMATVDLDSPPA